MHSLPAREPPDSIQRVYSMLAPIAGIGLGRRCIIFRPLGLSFLSRKRSCASMPMTCLGETLIFAGIIVLLPILVEKLNLHLLHLM